MNIPTVHINEATRRYTITFDYKNTLLTFDYSYTQMCSLGVTLASRGYGAWFPLLRKILEPYGVATYPSPTQDDESYAIVVRFTQFVQDFNQNVRKMEEINV